MLFDPYSKKTTQDLHARVKEAKTAEDLAALQELIPLSNWKRYFEKLVDCEDSYLESRWKKLYDLRCRVAHNGPMTARELEDTQKLVGEVKPKLTEAIGKLSRVNVPEDELETVAETANMVELAAASFMNAWDHLLALLANRSAAEGTPLRRGQLPGVELLLKWGLGEYVEILKELHAFRHRLVHGRQTVSMKELYTCIGYMEFIRAQVVNEGGPSMD